MLTKNELHEAISLGENRAMEFKQSDVRIDSLASEIVALSNTQGGMVLLGVGDDGEIVGLSEDKNYEEWVMNIARNNVIPNVQLEYQPYDFDGMTVGCITVPRGPDKPYRTVKAQYLIRVGSTNRIASQEELLRLFQASGAFHFDATAVRGTSINNLHMSNIDSYFRRYNLEFGEESSNDQRNMLINSDIMLETGELTVAGLLIFGINAIRYLPQAGISFAHFAGNAITDELIDKQNIDGTLSYQVDTGVALIKNNWRMPSKIVGTKREDLAFIYQDKVFRELLTNAVVHRNYAIHGSRVRVFMFDDRIEFRSPGRLPNAISIEKLKVGVSYGINPILVKFMENLRYIDHLGRGLPMVYYEACQNERNIEFKEVGEEFWVTLER